MNKVFILACALLCLPLTTQASGIRTAYVNDTRMHSISLKMGKATVLRFTAKPKKVVIGNQNYYSVEFIDNDLTLQPLGKAETNLFVYTPYRTYGFILQVCHSCRSDDLVFVKWKSNYRPATKPKRTKAILGFRAIGLDFSVGTGMSAVIIKTIVDKAKQLRIVDMQLKNRTTGKVDLAAARIFATRRGKHLQKQGYIIEKDVLKVGEMTKARLFLSAKEVKSFSVNVVINKRQGKKIISSGFLR